MTAEEKRLAVRDKYRTILGRNKYSQSKRNYCFKKASDGHYYSDCSSSVSYSHKESLGSENFGILNTVGMYQSKKFTNVPVKISKGQITNPEVLRIGDMLLYAGSDSGRAYAGYVGHVEMVGEISSTGKVTLYGHGSGTPKKTEMTAKNKSRYNSKTSTKLGNKGLICVKRFIQDDAVSMPTTPAVTPTGKTIEDIAREVINGKWGNGTARKEALEKAGYNYQTVQAMVNKLIR